MATEQQTENTPLFSLPEASNTFDAEDGSPSTSNTEETSSQMGKDSNTTNLIKKGIFADFEIETNDCTFRAHASVLWCRSTYFARLLSGSNKEVEERKVKIDDVPTCLIARLLLACYDSSKSYSTVSCADFAQPYPFKPWSDDYQNADRDNVVRAELEVELYMLADRFGIDSLMKRARKNFLRAWTNHNHLLCSGQQNWEMSAFSRDVLTMPEEFAKIARRVWTTTPQSDRGLRDIVFESFWYHINQRRHFQDKFKPLRDLVNELPDLAADMALFQNSDRSYKCTECAIQNVHVLSLPCTCEGRNIACQTNDSKVKRKERSFCINCARLGTVSSEKEQAATISATGTTTNVTGPTTFTINVAPAATT